MVVIVVGSETLSIAFCLGPKHVGVPLKNRDLYVEHRNRRPTHRRTGGRTGLNRFWRWFWIVVCNKTYVLSPVFLGVAYMGTNPTCPCITCGVGYRNPWTIYKNLKDWDNFSFFWTNQRNTGSPCTDRRSNRWIVGSSRMRKITIS